MIRPVDVVFTKWGGRPHWEQTSQYLGEDGFGHWIGAPVGQVAHRPGRCFTHRTASVLLARPGAQWVATFYADAALPDRADCQIYVDVTSPVQWSPDLSRVTMIDLDLDVFKTWDGDVCVDDEDEFDEHRVEFGYPVETVAAARATCTWLVEAVSARHEPFGSVYQEWLSQIT